MHLPAQTIADVYKERWQIELFFKWVKQNLKTKTFLGTSANAVMTQVWVALCLYLILAFIRFISKTVHSMREILNWIRINLFSNEILNDYLVPKMTEPSVNPQLALFWKVAGQQWFSPFSPSLERENQGDGWIKQTHADAQNPFDQTQRCDIIEVTVAKCVSLF